MQITGPTDDTTTFTPNINEQSLEKKETLDNSDEVIESSTLPLEILSDESLKNDINTGQDNSLPVEAKHLVSKKNDEIDVEETSSKDSNTKQDKAIALTPKHLKPKERNPEFAPTNDTFSLICSILRIKHNISEIKSYFDLAEYESSNTAIRGWLITSKNKQIKQYRPMPTEALELFLKALDQNQIVGLASEIEKDVIENMSNESLAQC